MAAKTTIKWPFTPGIHAQTETLNAPGKWQILADCTLFENGFYWPLMRSQCLAVPLEACHKVDLSVKICSGIFQRKQLMAIAVNLCLVSHSIRRGHVFIVLSLFPPGTCGSYWVDYEGH